MNAIVSVCADWGIGHAGSLLVRNPVDMRFFKDHTMGGCVIMGRKTFESFPHGPLEGRRNIVITRKSDYAPVGVEVVASPDKARELTQDIPPEQVWLIGGASIYRALIDSCERALVTKNDCTFPADAFFPNLDNSPAWTIESEQAGGTTKHGIGFRFVTYHHVC